MNFENMVVSQSPSCVRLFATPWTAVHQDSLSFAISRSLLKFFSIDLVMPSNHLFLCLIFLLPSIFPSIRVFSNELALRMRWPKDWSFRFSVMPSKEIPGLISFRMDWLALLAVQGTLKSLLQHHSSKSPTPKFRSINSLALRFLYGPTLTSTQDYWRHHSFDYTDFCQ